VSKEYSSFHSLRFLILARKQELSSGLFYQRNCPKLICYVLQCPFFVVMCRPTIGANVPALGEEADFEALNCLPALNVIRSTKLHLSTEPAFLPNAC
jgi:hypothetical protein